MFEAAQLTSGRRLFGSSRTERRQYTCLQDGTSAGRRLDSGTLLGPEGSEKISSGPYETSFTGGRLWDRP